MHCVVICQRSDGQWFSTHNAPASVSRSRWTHSRKGVFTRSVCAFSVTHLRRRSCNKEAGNWEGWSGERWWRVWSSGVLEHGLWLERASADIERTSSMKRDRRRATAGSSEREWVCDVMTHESLNETTCHANVCVCDWLRAMYMSISVDLLS